MKVITCDNNLPDTKRTMGVAYQKKMDDVGVSPVIFSIMS